MVTQFDMTRQNEIRKQRAESEFSRYNFRRVVIAGQPAVYVIAPQGAIYTVNARTRRCNCPDSMIRCEGTAAFCKHSHAASRFLAELTAAQEEAARIEESRRMVERDFPGAD